MRGKGAVCVRRLGRTLPLRLGLARMREDAMDGAGGWLLLRFVSDRGAPVSGVWTCCLAQCHDCRLICQLKPLPPPASPRSVRTNAASVRVASRVGLRTARLPTYVIHAPHMTPASHTGTTECQVSAWVAHDTQSQAAPRRRSRHRPIAAVPAGVPAESARRYVPPLAFTLCTSVGVAPHRRRVHRSIAWPRWRRRRCPRAAARCA